MTMAHHWGRVGIDCGGGGPGGGKQSIHPEKSRFTFDAETNIPFPPRSAATVHVPLDKYVTTLFDTVQTEGVKVAKVTGKAELSVALS
jgi:hypothetical protein